MTRKYVGVTAIVLGALVLVVALVADLLGIGSDTGIGWKQLLGAGIGLVVALVGVWLLVGKSKSTTKKKRK